MHLHPEDVYLQARDKENVRPSAYQQPAFLIQPAGKKDGNRPAGMHMTPEKHKDKKDKKAQGTPSVSDGFPCAFLSLRQPESEVTHRH